MVSPVSISGFLYLDMIYVYYGGFLKRGTPKSSEFNVRMFHCNPSSFWATPINGPISFSFRIPPGLSAERMESLSYTRHGACIFKDVTLQVPQGAFPVVRFVSGCQLITGAFLSHGGTPKSSK